jgi:hypothetical protein
MPGPLVIQKPELPASINPQGASVFDAPGQGILRKMVSLLGLDDPQQIMGVGAAMDVGPMGGGLLDAAAKRFPRFAQAIKAYHGSPHDFEAFDTSKIGTGEGAQAYGHGLYFAENPEVAAEYRKQLSGHDLLTVRVPGKAPIAGNAIDDIGLQAVQFLERGKQDAGQFPHNTAYYAQKRADAAAQGLPGAAERNALVKARIDEWANAKIGYERNPGRTYEVGINAHPDQFLDWDKPLSQQSQSVQDALKQLPGLREAIPIVNGDQPFHEWARAFQPSAPGADIARVKVGMALKATGGNVDQAQALFWQQLGNQGTSDFRATADSLWRGLQQVKDTVRVVPAGLDTRMTGQEIIRKAGLTPETSSEALKAAGIPGIKYLDQGSRAMPYRGDPAFLHAAQSFKDSGAAPDAALAGLQSAYPKAPLNDLHGAVNELYGTSLGQTRNFVVFDAKTIDILKKYGLLLPAAGAGLAASQQEGQ